MYSSLERVDVTLDGGGGTQVYVQTDHRETDEIAATPELSVLFAIARVTNARRAAPSKRKVRVAYFAQYEPPAVLDEVLGLLGAELFVDQEARPLQVRPGSVEGLLNEHAQALAERVRSERKLAFDRPSLETLARASVDTPSAEEDEPLHWTRVLELGAFAGRVLSTLGRCRWIVEEKKSGVVPYVLRIEVPGAPLAIDLMAGAAAAVSGAPDGILRQVAEASDRLRAVQ